MRKTLSTLLLAAISFLVPVGNAQDTTIIPIESVTIPVTHTFKLGPAIAFIQPPPAGWNLSRVLPGASARLELAEEFAGATDVKWFLPHNVTISTGIVTFLEINAFSTSNDGSYFATFTLNGNSGNSAQIELKTTPFAHAALKNISSRTRLSPENPQLVAGFVVGAEGITNGMTRLVLIRAVGSTLSNFDVANPLPDPELQVYDASGNEVAPVPRWDQNQIHVGWDNYEDYLEDLTTHLGAFPVPIPDPATDGPPGEPVHEYLLSPGSYTAVVKSTSNTTGDVLLEVYESRALNPLELFGGLQTNAVPASEQ